MYSQNPLSEANRNTGFRTQLRNVVLWVFRQTSGPYSPVPNSRVLGTHQPAPGVRRVRRRVPDSVGGRPQKTALKSGDKNQCKRRVSALSLTGACRFTYL